MAKRKFTLTQREEQELVNEFLQNKDGPTRTRCQAVRLYGTGYGFTEIQTLTSCSRASLMEWCRFFAAQGVAGLRDKRLGGNRAKLTRAQREELKNKLSQSTPAQLFGPQATTREGQFWTVEDLYRAVKQWYGVEYKGRNSYTELLGQSGFSYQRPAKVFKSRSPAKIADFEEQVEKKVVDRAQETVETIYLAEDEASLYLQTTTQAVWSLRGQTPVVRSAAQRDKVNFYGTLNLHTGQEIVLRTLEMKGAKSVEHLEQILAAYPTQHIVLFWDRASWHKGERVRQFLEAHPRLEVVYFPVASPELNPQEHVWKATRQAVSHNHLVAKLPELADQFEKHLLHATFESSFLYRYGYGAIHCPNFI